VSDLISRQDAIDLADDLRDYISVEGYWAWIERLKGLPSAQPEIIRCHSCKHWTRTIGEMRGFGLGICDFHNAEYVTCNGFCHWAERREE